MSMINWEKVRELREEIGDDGFDEILEVFLEEVEEALENLANGNASELGSSLHFIKGCALNLGFEKLASLCAAGEIKAISSEGDTIDIREIIATYAASKSVFLSDLGKIN